MTFKQHPVFRALKTFVFAAGLLLMAPHGAFAQVQTEMRLFSDSFISPSFEATQRTNYQFVGAQLKTDPFAEGDLKMSVSGGVAIGAPLLNYLNISEFYMVSRQTETETFYLGRKKMLWSELDSRWDLGVWEPLFTWNPLNAENQGLTGLFWQMDKPFYTLTLFASPLYIPDQGPSFEIEDGAFVRGNPWFRRPPESIRIWQEATAIDYQFEKPNESHIVLQNSFGMKLTFGDPQSFRGQLAYTYKPANQLAIGYDGNLNIAELKGAVNLQPQVFYHSLVSADVAYKIGRFRLGLSGIYDKPNKDEIFEEKWTHPVFSDALMVSPFVEWNNGFLGVSLQHLDIFGGKVTEEGKMADSSRIPLMSRYPYQQATQLAFMGNFNLTGGKRMTTRVSYTHSEKNQFDLIRVSARLRMSGLWSFLGEMQIVKAASASSENQNDIAQFANNDRLMLGAAYAF